jgi:hypothetical protein
MLEPKRRIMRALSLGLALGSALAVATSRPARASSSFGISARPIRVLFEPGPADTADRVRIQGMIALGADVMDFAAPTCGYLYFKCTAGDEALCREQWKEIAAAADAGRCVMFGAHRGSNGSLLVNGRVRPFSEPASQPDTFISNQGLGVVTVDCAGDLVGTCVVPPDGAGGAGGRGGGTGGDGPAPGAAGHGGGGAGAGVGGGLAAGSGGATSSGGSIGSGGRGSGGAPPPVDGSADGPSPGKGKDGGCSVAGGAWGTAPLAAALALLGSAAARRARRRKGPR